MQRAYYYNAMDDSDTEDRYEMWLEYRAILEASGGEFGVPPVNYDYEKAAMMKDFLILNKWEMGYDDMAVDPSSQCDPARGWCSSSYQRLCFRGMAVDTDYITITGNGKELVKWTEGLLW